MIVPHNITVGSPHTWPSVLAMLSWLVDVVNTYQIIDPMKITFPDDFNPEIRLAKAKLSTLVKLIHTEEDEERQQSVIEVFFFICHVFLSLLSFYCQRFCNLLHCLK